jgi:3-oxoacid CoA-transferase subunit A
MNKVVASADIAVADIGSGVTVMLGGFGLCGIPENLIAALVRRGVTGLHTISNNMGVDGFGMGLMLEAGMIASHVGSYVGENRMLEALVLKGELDLTLGRVVRGFLRSILRRGWERLWRRGKRRVRSTVAGMCWRPRCMRMSR